MQARMKNPAMVLPDAMKGIQNLYKAMHQGGVPQQLLELVHLRASQINGCSACVYAGVQGARKAGETDDRLATLAAWRETPFFNDAERAALALTEAATRLADRSGDAVPDDIWDAAADNFDERQISAIILMVAVTNLFNRINATIKEPAGASWT
ncbi:carboxymuconolactone decarboxylase family protein [Dactylosporangium sp. McL0621]|uniref:carboxymuconolactone decarboxylase family protein n=1 Tax=Dactylosporangium sp. McL0621 TaxID=3415678 RepID=UPI003CF9114B